MDKLLPMSGVIQKVQRILGVSPDGIWGPKSQAALNREIGKTKGSGNSTLQKIQRVMRIEADGIWGRQSQGALNRARADVSEFSATASSFADPADVAAFKRCKTTGKTDRQCFAFGDNGIGQFGAITAQEKVPMVAVHADDMKARWGSVPAAAHRPVVVTVKGRSIQATVEDRLGVRGRIDLNPAAAKALGLRPPFLVQCVWKWGVLLSGD
jgi:hypothetical protein